MRPSRSRRSSPRSWPSEADAVFGSRTMIKGAARRGGMPLYKFAGNRILSRFENAALGTHLSEFHSGYRAYSVSALKQIPFEKNSDGFNFDTQIIIQMHDAGMHIAEVPIPTYYGDEICYVDGLGYAKDVTKDVITYRLQKAGFGDGSRIALSEEYQLKPSEDSSHGRITEATAGPTDRAGSSTSDARAACSRSGCDGWAITSWEWT